MPDYSQHYNLIKPKKEENYDIDDVNRINADIIDSELYSKVEKEAEKVYHNMILMTIIKEN